MQLKLQDKFGAKLLFEEDHRDRPETKGSARSRTQSKSSHNNISSSNHKSMGSRSRSNKRSNHFTAKSTSLIQKLT